MKTVIYTQRVQIVEEYGERRDCADQRLAKFLYHCDFMPVPVPNVPELIERFMSEIRPRGIVLSGGNSLGKYDGDAPERDQTERFLLEYALKNMLPVFGICRGMQFIADYFGVKLSPIENHVRMRHPIHGVIERDAVNSYHTLGFFDVPDELRVLARAEDHSIEAISHWKLRIAAIGWHPEREENFDEEDIGMLKRFF